eukprot:gene8950-899_t
MNLHGLAEVILHNATHCATESEFVLLPWWQIIIYACISIFLILFAGLMSGLTLGLLSLDPMQLSVLKTAGTEHEKKLAKRIELVVKNHHYLLVTLLLMNALAMESLPLFLDKIVPEWAAIIISVTMVLLFGEIVPQAICARYGLHIGAYLNYFVLFLMIISFPIAFPVSILLDKMLGKDHKTFYRRGQLKELVSIHARKENSVEPENGPLSSKELHLIRGALELQEKTVTMVMTPIESVYMIENSSIFDQTLLDELKNVGHSRIPIYQDEKKNIQGYILAKFLIGVSPKAKIPITQMKMFDATYVQTSDELWTVFNGFIKGKNHLAFIKNDFGKVIGIITLEDIVEELLKEEIIDETDVYVDIQKKIRVVDSQLKKTSSFLRMRTPTPQNDDEINEENEIRINLLEDN